MPGAIFSRIKNWTAEKLTNEDLNAEIDNILDNFKPDQMDDYSINVAQMQSAVDPGELGSEAVATTLAGELERLRFAIGEIKGTTQWYESGDSTIAELASALGGGLADNRIISGLTSANSSSPVFLIPAGNDNVLTLDANPTALLYAVEGTTYSIGSDLTASGLITAPTSNNTCLVDDAEAGDEDYTRYLGMYGTVILVDAVGSEITGRDGVVSAFKINDGSIDEYFTGIYDNSLGLIRDCRRGYFFNSSSAPIPATPFADHDTITLMKLTWIFATAASTIVVSYLNPIYSAVEPVSPSTGQYWFDVANDTWKTFDSAQWIDANAHLIGTCIQDESGNTVGAKSYDLFKNFEKLDTMLLERVSATEVRTIHNENTINVYGTRRRWEHGRLAFNIATDLASGLSESANTTYFLYLQEDGTPVMDEDAPYDRRSDLLGWYHPHEAWRCVGKVDNDGSSNLDATTLVSLYASNESDIFSNDQVPVGEFVNLGTETIPPGYIVCEGASLSKSLYYPLFAGKIGAIGGNFGTAVDKFEAPAAAGKFMRYHDNGAAADPNAGARSTMATGGASGDSVGSIQADATAVNGIATTSGGSHNHTTTTERSTISAIPAGSNTVEMLDCDEIGFSSSTHSISTTNSQHTHSYTGDAETRPLNFYAKLVVKYSGDR